MIIGKDDKISYLTPDSGNKGVWPAIHFVCLASNYTLSNIDTQQKLFNQPSNGALTLGIGTYFFECLFSITGMSATSGNLTFDFKGGGGATVGTVLYHATGHDINDINSALNVTYQQFSSNSYSATPLLVGTTQTGLHASIRGTFRVTVAGTIIPSVTLQTAIDTAVVKAGSYFKCFCVGASDVTTCGSWT